MRRQTRRLGLGILLACMLLFQLQTRLKAQSTDQRYFSPKLGLTFSYPEGWDVEQVGNALITCDPSDLQLLADNQPPEGLVIRVYEGNRAFYNVSDMQGLPEILATVGPVGPSKATTVNDYQALRADKTDSSGGAIAVRIDESRWALIVTQSSDWVDDTPLFEEILSTFSFGPEGIHASKTIPIKYGAKLHQVFNPGETQFTYSFSAKITELVTITMVADTGDTLDPALVLVGPDNNIVARNDDSFDQQFGMINARIVKFPIPKTGTYTIQAINTVTTGSGFTLTLAVGQ